MRYHSYLLLVKTIISSESDLCDSEYFSKIYLAECILYQYQMSSKTEPEVYRLDFDIVKLRKEDIFFEKDTFIKIYKKDNSVRVARLIIEFSRG